MLAIGVTVAALAGVSAAWPADDLPGSVDADGPPTTLMTKEAAAAFTPAPGGVEVPDLGGIPAPLPPPDEEADLFGDGPEVAVQELLAAAGGPTHLHEIAIYPTYLFVAYRDPAGAGQHRRAPVARRGRRSPGQHRRRPGRRQHRARALLRSTSSARRCAWCRRSSTTPPRHYQVPTEVTHVIIDRFVPFDQRVLIRVYASPTDGRSGGGYVTYTTGGTFEKVCC